MKSLIINIVVDDNIHIEINNMSREDANEFEHSLAGIIEKTLCGVLDKFQEVINGDDNDN